MVESVCRSDQEHYCVECCPKDCCLLGELIDKTKGCLGHNSSKGKDDKNKSELPQRQICIAFNCLEGTASKDSNLRLQVIKTIKGMPAGEFKMSKVLKIIQLV